jgi:hypothetical protein
VRAANAQRPILIAFRDVGAGESYSEICAR